MFSTDLTSTRDDLSPKSAHIASLREQVFALWEQEVRARISGTEGVTHPVLVDTLPLFYGNLVEALTPDFPRENAASGSSAAAGHGSERARTTEYTAVEVVEEYHILRKVLLQVCRKNGIAFDEGEMQIITDSFDQAIREAVNEFTEIQKDFRARVAGALTHDMRSPLSVIIGAANLLARSTDNSVRHLAGKIHENGMRLETMFKQQLNLVQKPPVRVDRIDVSHWDILPLAREICEHQNAVQAAVCRVSGHETPVWWDRMLIQRALENLVGNAIKYGDKKEIMVHVSSLHGRAIVSVHNTGNPIREEKRQQLFEYLNRGDATEKPGWGIGLAFVQDVAARHGGTVVLDSSEEAGTTFTLDIPCDSRHMHCDGPA